MKARLGFVSNSSSSSFCLIGTYMDEEDIGKALKKEFKEKFDKADDVYSFLADHDLVLCAGEECSVVGVDIEDLDYDKSINQLKKEVSDKLGQIFKQPREADLYYDTSYDG